MQMEEEDDAVGMLLQLLDDLLIYEPGTVLEYAGKKPSREDLESIQSDTTVRILRILKRYVRPRNEVLRIRRTVNRAFREGDVGDDSVFSEYTQVKEDIERLKAEKTELEGRLRMIKGKKNDVNDTRDILLGNMFLQKTQKKGQLLQIYQRHWNMLLNQQAEQVDNQTTLVPLPSVPYPEFPSLG
jgi:predicted nuclease with TOPRIM domain